MKSGVARTLLGILKFITFYLFIHYLHTELTADSTKSLLLNMYDKIIKYKFKIRTWRKIIESKR